MINQLTETQSKLWKLADKAMVKLGGPRIHRHPDAKKEGTKIWAVCQAYSLAHCSYDEMMNDSKCQILIDIIEG